MSNEVNNLTFRSGVSVVVPVYNSQATLIDLVDRIASAMQNINRDFEIILVNDGSSDGSGEVVRKLMADNAWLHGINLTRNYGQHNAILCGIRVASKDVIVTLDDDLQHPPEEIGKLLTKLEEGYDVVYGTPLTEQHGLWRDLASQVTKMVLQNTMGASTARSVSAFRAFRTSVRQGFEDYKSPHVSIDVLLSWVTNRFAAIPVRHEPRKVGRSNYTFRKLLIHTITVVTGFTVWPLQLASFVGFTLTITGVCILIYVVGAYIGFGQSVPGFAFLASIVSIFSGAQLFSLGIIGEYLARIHYRLMDRPSYVVREEIDPL